LSSDVTNVPLTRATEDWADAQLEAEFARLNPEIQRRVALRVLETNALKREVQALRATLQALADEARKHRSDVWCGDYDKALTDAQVMLASKRSDRKPKKVWGPERMRHDPL
jgi:hypothetical protein